MGIYDREYYRDDKPAGIHLSGQWSMVTRLIALNAAIQVLNLFVGSEEDWLVNVLSATPESLTNPLRWWQLVSYGFAHDPEQIAHIFWNMLALWFFGREIEALYGPKEFLRLYLVVIVLGGVIWATRSYFTIDPQFWEHYSVLGASGAVTAVVLLFCINYPKRTVLLMFVLPVPAWAVGMMIIVGNVFGLVHSEERIAFDVHLVGAALAICYYRFGWNFGRWMPSISIPKRWLKPKPKLKLHDPEVHYRDLDAKADELLAKVNREGIESLSPKERRMLEDYSRRMRQKHR